MHHQTQIDYAFTMGIVALIVIVFVLDLLTPFALVIWYLYVIPLGLSSLSSNRGLLPITAGVCSVLVILGYFYSPLGGSFEYAVINRGVGIVMLWAVTFFLSTKRDGGAS